MEGAAVAIQDFHRAHGHGAKAELCVWLRERAGISFSPTQRALFGCVAGTGNGDNGNWMLVGSGGSAVVGMWPVDGSVTFTLRGRAASVAFNVVANDDNGGHALCAKALRNSSKRTQRTHCESPANLPTGNMYVVHAYMYAYAYA